MAAFIQEMEWKRVTIIWQPFESFADYNFNLLVDTLGGLVELHTVELSFVSGSPDYNQWAASTHDAKQYHDRVWVILAGPNTAKQLIPWMYGQGMLEPWMQLVVPGSCKAAMMGMVKSDVLGGPKRSTLEGAIVVRPLTFHTASDGWKAESFFERLSARSLADFKNSATAYAEAFDPVTKFGNVTVQAMLDNPAAVFESLHIWTLAYGVAVARCTSLTFPRIRPRLDWETCLPHADALYTFLFAIDDLLRQGYNATDIKGQLLHNTLREQVFVGEH